MQARCSQTCDTSDAPHSDVAPADGAQSLDDGVELRVGAVQRVLALVSGVKRYVLEVPAQLVYVLMEQSHPHASDSARLA